MSGTRRRALECRHVAAQRSQKTASPSSRPRPRANLICRRREAHFPHDSDAKTPRFSQKLSAPRSATRNVPLPLRTPHSHSRRKIPKLVELVP